MTANSDFENDYAEFDSISVDSLEEMILLNCPDTTIYRFPEDNDKLGEILDFLDIRDYDIRDYLNKSENGNDNENDNVINDNENENVINEYDNVINDNENENVINENENVINDNENENVINENDNVITDNEKRILAEKKEYWRKYHLEYYHKYKTYKVECEHCKRIVTKDALRRHLKSYKCTKIREMNNNNNNNNNTIA